MANRKRVRPSSTRLVLVASHGAIELPESEDDDAGPHERNDMASYGQCEDSCRPSDLVLRLIVRSAESENAPDRLAHEHAVEHAVQEMPQTHHSAAPVAPLRAMLGIRDGHDQLPQHKRGQAGREDREHRIAEQGASELRQRPLRSVGMLVAEGREQREETDRKVECALGDVATMADPALPPRERAVVVA